MTTPTERRRRALFAVAALAFASCAAAALGSNRLFLSRRAAEDVSPPAVSRARTAGAAEVAAAAAALSPPSAPSAQGGGAFALPIGVVASGGRRSAGGGFAVEGTMGQPAAGASAGGSFTLDGGFVPAAQQDPSPTPSPGTNTVQFEAATAAATETPGGTTFVELTVTRTGDTSGAAAVDYATSDGTAGERSDYLLSLGTLRFAAGEASKTVTVFIVDDSYGEPLETFLVTLSGPSGCALGTPMSVTVTVVSDEGADGPNPTRNASFSSDFFVREHYTDFLNRAPDASGLLFWKNQLDECTTQECRDIRRINVSAAFYLSIEFQQTGYLVYRTHQAAFDTGERLRLRAFMRDTQEIGRGVVIGEPGADQLIETNRVAFFNHFVARPAFLAQYPPTLSAAQFVDALNANTGGSLSQGERDGLVNSLSAGTLTRAQVLRAVAEDGDFNARERNRAFVLMQYFGYLRRNPDDPPELTLDYQGYNFWLGKLNQFGGNHVAAEMVKAFINSEEYKKRFGP